jgi:hypothetical protein
VVEVEEAPVIALQIRSPSLVQQQVVAVLVAVITGVK